MLRNRVNDDRPKGTFYGGRYCGHVRYHGDNNQLVVIHDTHQRKDWPEQIEGEELDKLEGLYLPYGSQT